MTPGVAAVESGKWDQLMGRLWLRAEGHQGGSRELRLGGWKTGIASGGWRRFGVREAGLIRSSDGTRPVGDFYETSTCPGGQIRLHISI